MIIGGHGQTHIFAAKYDHCHPKTIFQSKWQFSSQMAVRESSCLQILCVRFHRSHCLLYSRICKSPSSVFSGSHLIALYDSMSSLPPACLFPPITANPASLSSLYHHYHLNQPYHHYHLTHLCFSLPVSSPQHSTSFALICLRLRHLCLHFIFVVHIFFVIVLVFDVLVFVDFFCCCLMCSFND